MTIGTKDVGHHGKADDGHAEGRAMTQTKSDDDMKIKELLEQLTGPSQTHLALAVNIKSNRVQVDFPSEVSWIAFTKPQLEMFIALLTEKGKELK